MQLLKDGYQLMFKYPDGSFRFVSKDPIKTGDRLITGYNAETQKYIYKEVVEIKEPSRPDKGKWSEAVLTQIIKLAA